MSRVLHPVASAQRSTSRGVERVAKAIPAEADLIILGDSLAAGWPPDLIPLSRTLRVFNFGVPGERIQNTLWRLDALDTAHLRPHWMLLLLGTNNLADGDSLEAIVAGLEAVLETTARLWANPWSIVVSIPPRRDGAGCSQADRVALNRRLTERVTERGRCRVIDADAAFGSSDPAGLSLEADQLHLSDSGYRALGSAVRRGMEALQTGAGEGSDAHEGAG